MSEVIHELKSTDYVGSDDRRRFVQLAEKWKSETMFQSCPITISEHRAYQEIIAMGWKAVPLILEDLNKEADLWFEALEKITREQPIPKEHYGKIEAMSQDWLNWGRAHGYEC